MAKPGGREVVTRSDVELNKDDKCCFIHEGAPGRASRVEKQKPA